MKISFVVLTYNRADALLAVLHSLAAQCGPEHEVVIADDGSNEQQVGLLLSHLPVFKCAVRYVWHPDTGFTAAAARNLGANCARGEYLVFLDGDCVPNKSFVRAHGALAQNGCFVNGSRVLLSERLSNQAVRGKTILPDQTKRFWWSARLKGDSNKLLHTLAWPWSLFRVKRGFSWRGIRSCNLGVWRDDFVRANGFDETFEGWGHEDADLVLRLSHLGVKRKNGFLATEVFHLWHRESPRGNALANQQKVIDRMQTKQIRAEKGLAELQVPMAIAGSSFTTDSANAYPLAQVRVLELGGAKPFFNH
jgi:glycosyltransferase involved in cell wall biosynthesis